MSEELKRILKYIQGQNFIKTIFAIYTDTES